MSLEDIIKIGLADIAAAIREGNKANAEQHAKSLAVVEGKRDGGEASSTAAKETKKTLQKETQKPADETKDDIENLVDEADQSQSLTKEDVISAFKIYVARHKRDAAVSLLSTFGVDKLAELEPEDYATFMEAIKDAG